MFERPQNGERAILVFTQFDSALSQDDVQEFRELTRSAGVEIVAEVNSARKRPDPNLLVGSGKAQEILAEINANKADVVLIDHILSPVQERNLERLLKCQVLDRTGVILDIFAQRASSHEGRLQVELAQLKHLSTRLVRGWTHLERQKGGIGLRGPGETQLETDRRLISVRIKQLKKKLEKVRNSRTQSRKSRNKAELPTVSLVGYTNAGKSTLFNQLTQSKVYAADQLFATLDPTLRRIELSPGNPMILADTVGFIRNLPHDLVESFHSTLEETREASLLLHVVDVSHVDHQGCIEQVNKVLEEIGAQDVPQIMVFNKVDLTPNVSPRVDYNADGSVYRVWLSAQEDKGIDLLLEALNQYFSRQFVHTCLRVSAATAGKLRARLFEFGNILKETSDDHGSIVLQVSLPRKYLGVIRNQEDIELIDENGMNQKI